MLLFGFEVETAMICAKCRRQIDAGVKRCPACAGDPLLDARYRLDHSLAEDSRGASYRATRTEDGLLVRARALPYRQLAHPDGAGPHTLDGPLGDALDRVKVVDHPALPRLLDHRLESHGSRGTLWLIYEHLRGRPLPELATAEPERMRDPSWLLELIVNLADVLAHLHAHSPPLVHGAVAPERILVRPDSASSKFALLDLDIPDAGPAQAGGELARELALLAPEQLYEPPGPASDVWALGLVVVLLLSGERPSTLRNAERALVWREHVRDPQLRELLEGVLAPDPEARPSSAQLRDAASKASSTAPSSASLPGQTERGASAADPNPRPQAERRTPPTAPRPNKPTPRFMMSEPMPPRPSRAAPAPPLSRGSGRSSSTRGRRASSSAEDIPIMRPEDLSRELSQAYHATAALEERQRRHLAYARVLVILIAATIAALATYLALKL
jgi:serine/threonine protein kinase